MSREKMGCWVRAAGCAVLVALLAVCSYMGARQGQTTGVSVPVAVKTVSGEVLAAASLEETQAKLMRERKEALALLESVLGDERAGAEAREEALKEKTALAGRMAAEAEVTAILAQMGFADAAVVLGEQSLSVILPWQAAENEQNRLRIIDAAATHTGLSPACVKIILSKK